MAETLTFAKSHVYDTREREMPGFADEPNRAKYGGQWVALDGDQY